MLFFDSLNASFSYRDQVNLICRIRIRLGLADKNLFPTDQYVSEEEIDKRFPICSDVFSFSNWKEFREEMEQMVIEHVFEPQLLESLLVRYFKLFDFSSQVLFPDEKYSDDDDLNTSITLRSLASYYGYNTTTFDPTARAALAEYLHNNVFKPVTEEFLNILQKDLFLLHRLLNAMHFVAEIIQGLLYETSAPFSIQTLQDSCSVKLTDELYSWKMAPLLGWTSAFCRKLMGNRNSINLDIESVDLTYSDNQKENNRTPSSGVKEMGKKEIELSEETISAIDSKTYKRLIFLSDDKIKMLGEDLINAHVTKRFGESLIFTAPATLYAYMGYRIKVVCSLAEIPWQQLLGILPHAKIRKDNNYIKGRASFYKKTQSFPPESSIIDKAINRVFKIPESD